MTRKLVLAVLVIAAVFASAAYAEGEETYPQVNVGGHIKLSVFDRVNAISQVGVDRYEWNRSFATAFKELNLYVNAKINDWVSFEADPKFSVSTGATPSIGKTGPGAQKGFSFSSMGHGKAVMMLELPYDIHVEVGQLHPVFTMEYGKYLFWEDEFNVGPFVGSHGPAGAFHDSGIEATKVFEIGDISLPVTLYYLNGFNGAGGADDNNQPGGMIHVEPSMGPLTLSGSFYITRPDAEERLAQSGHSLGFIFKWEGLTVRGEYANGWIEQGESATEDLRENGYFVKVLYKVLPWLQVSFSHEYDLEAFGTAEAVRSVRYQPGMQIYMSDSTMFQISVDMQQQTMLDGSDSIVWTRPGAFVRSTF